MEVAKRRPFILNLVWAGGGALCMIIILLAYGTFARLLTGEAPAFPTATITIQHAGHPPIPLSVELAISARQKSYGLMFRRSLPEHSGMLFVWDTDQPVSFWMKNTYIPLDMLFVRRDGVIVKIVSHTKPLDTTLIPSGEPVRGVLEINAGAAERLGIETGDKIVFPAGSAKP